MENRDARISMAVFFIVLGVAAVTILVPFAWLAGVVTRYVSRRTARPTTI